MSGGGGDFVFSEEKLGCQLVWLRNFWRTKSLQAPSHTTTKKEKKLQKLEKTKVSGTKLFLNDLLKLDIDISRIAERTPRKEIQKKRRGRAASCWIILADFA